MSQVTESDASAVQVSDDRSRVDLDVVWGFLSTAAYWGRWRSRDDVEAQVADLDGVAVGQHPRGRHGERPGIEFVRGGGHAGRGRDLLEGHPVIGMLVSGDDEDESGRVAFDEVQEDGRIVGRVDE